MTPDQEETAARAVLTAPQFAFITGAAGDESAKRNNALAWQQVRLGHRHPVNVERISTRADMFGHMATMPLAVAPMGTPHRVRPDADLHIAHAANEAGVPVVLSTFAGISIEDAAATGADLAFQLYWLHDRDSRWSLVRRAEQAGCETLVVTVDCPVRAGSYREAHTEFRGGEPAMVTSTRLDPTLTDDDLAEIATATSMNVAVKGVLSASAARRIISIPGIDEVIVSNHGGRQLASAAASADVLGGIADAVGADGRVFVDGGIRSGEDILRALALGAHGVLIGRQVLYAVAVDGSLGVERLFDRLAGELETAMRSAGVRTCEEARVSGLVVPERG